jgi:hypothetical protein
MPDLALGNDDFGPEPGSFGICRPAAAGNGKSGAVETGLGPQPEAHGRMPAQLTPLEFGQALLPLRIWRVAQAALDNPAMPGDHPASQRQAGDSCEYERSDKQDYGESKFSRHPRRSPRARVCPAGRLALSRPEQRPVVPHVGRLLRTHGAR